jgi:hypothetical protein
MGIIDKTNTRRLWNMEKSRKTKKRPWGLRNNKVLISPGFLFSLIKLKMGMRAWLGM